MDLSNFAVDELADAISATSSHYSRENVRIFHMVARFYFRLCFHSILQSNYPQRITAPREAS